MLSLHPYKISLKDSYGTTAVGGSAEEEWVTELAV